MLRAPQAHKAYRLLHGKEDECRCIAGPQLNAIAPRGTLKGCWGPACLSGLGFTWNPKVCRIMAFCRCWAIILCR